MNLHELAKRSGVKWRSIKHYYQHGLVKSPDYRGAATSYDEEHLAQVLAIKEVCAGRRLKLEQIRERLAEREAEHRAAAEEKKKREAARASEGEVIEGAVRWQRFELLPGLELAVRDDASVTVKRIARETIALHRSVRPNAARE